MKLLFRWLLLCFIGQASVFAQNLEQAVIAPNCEKPSYPSASKLLNEEGTVQLKFFVSLDGRVIDSAVEKSSGFQRLDEAAKQSLSKCTFKPGTRDGVNVESSASIKYTWKLSVFAPCVGSDVAKWKSCLGTLTNPIGGLSVVEYEAGKKNGRGIEYDAAGNVIRAGIFEGEKLVSERTLDIKLYPFNAQLTATSASQPINLVAIQPDISSTTLPACQGSDVSSWTNCFGTQSYAKGHSYVGEFKDGMFDGQGTEYFVSGFKYVGQYKGGKRSGQGIHYKLDGSILQSGSWLNDVLVKPIELDKSRPSFNTPTQFAISNSPSTTERDRLNAEVDAERKKRQELEEQLRVAQQSTQPNKPAVTTGLERRIALVVGNANYKVRPLKNSRNDADDVSRSLKTTGFEVIDLRNATLPQMRTAVRQFGDRLVNNDVGLVYYSGHGVEVKGRNYFIPVNADIQREDEIADQGLDVSLILEKMSTAGKGVNILIVDACRDDPFGRSFRSSSRGLANMDAPRGTIIAYATSPGKVASDGDPRERNSPYTKHLVKAMQSPNKPIEQVFKEVRRAVQDETKNQQTPWENTSLSGDFFFRVQR
jgi:TonB family protein